MIFCETGKTVEVIGRGKCSSNFLTTLQGMITYPAPREKKENLQKRAKQDGIYKWSSSQEDTIFSKTALSILCGNRFIKDDYSLPRKDHISHRTRSSENHRPKSVLKKGAIAMAMQLKGGCHIPTFPFQKDRADLLWIFAWNLHGNVRKWNQLTPLSWEMSGTGHTISTSNVGQ